MWAEHSIYSNIVQCWQWTCINLLKKGRLMHKIKTTSAAIDWESQRVLSQIAEQITQPLEDIRRLLQHLKNKSESTDIETNRLSSIMLESSEQIESLIEDMIKVEEDKRIEILIHNKFRYPDLYQVSLEENFSSNQLLDTLERNAGDRISKADLTWLIQVENTILENIDYFGLNVSWLAQKMAVSERQIFRKIERFTGRTPNKYIRCLRLFKAKELLESYTYSTVSEVACAVGLKDPYYFSNIYKKEFGKKPKEYLG